MDDALNDTVYSNVPVESRKQQNQPSHLLVHHSKHDSIPEQVLAAAELLLQRSREAAALSPWWLNASPEQVAVQIESYRKAIRSVQNQLSTSPDPAPQQQLHYTQQPAGGGVHENKDPAAVTTEAAAVQSTARQRSSVVSDKSQHGQQHEDSEAADIEAGRVLHGDKGTGSTSDDRTTPDPDSKPDAIQEVRQVPPHSIPIHANVTTYDWGPMIQSRQFDVIMMDPPWQLATANPTRGVALGYSQLNDEAIASLPVPELQRNGFLFVWVINAKYKWTLDLFDRWGYE
ncbi:MAG: hypothetical protein WDW38_010740 [Sanguina aurantia]